MPVRAARVTTLVAVVAASAVLLIVTGGSPPVQGQPTYKLDVRSTLKPKATLALVKGGEAITRSAVTDDPGFRLRLHFKKAGKTLALVDARADDRAKLPSLEAGEYSVVLELFYPAYKGGTAQKGEFKPISDVLAYRVEAGGKASFVASTPSAPPATPKK